MFSGLIHNFLIIRYSSFQQLLDHFIIKGIAEIYLNVNMLYLAKYINIIVAIYLYMHLLYSNVHLGMQFESSNINI